MGFEADLLARRQRHEDELKALRGVEHSSKRAVVARGFFDIGDESVLHDGGSIACGGSVPSCQNRGKRYVL